jgi:tetratricopeptide (TPR) repeat protein
MDRRIAAFGVLGVVALAGAGAWWMWKPTDLPADSATEAVDSDGPLPVPPVPPRIAEGADYEKCLAMLTNDPSGARDFAEAWLPRGGGDAATHCLALARVELGDPAEGAKMLQDLAAHSRGPAAARAEIFGQADQAWLMAGDNQRAYEAATLALTLSPADADLLVDHATVAGALDHFDESLDDLNRALDADPKRADALVLRGSAQRHLGHLDLAENDVNRALLIDPDNVEALLERGILRQRVDDQVGARSDWERAISLEPDSPTADLAQQNLALLDAGPVR